VRLHEKGGKEHDVPCHHNLDHFLDEYIAAAGIADDAGGYLFRTTVRKSGVLTEKPMHQQDAYRMIQRRAKAAGIETKIGNHTFRATGITAYLKNSGKLEVAQHIANHESPPCWHLCSYEILEKLGASGPQRGMTDFTYLCWASPKDQSDARAWSVWPGSSFKRCGFFWTASGS
jgi:integrase